MLTLLASCASPASLLSKKRIFGVTGVALGLSLMQPQMAFAQDDENTTEYASPSEEAPAVSDSFEMNDVAEGAPEVEAAPVPKTRGSHEEKEKAVIKKAAPKKVKAQPKVAEKVEQVEQKLPTETKAEIKAKQVEQAPAVAAQAASSEIKEQELSTDLASTTEPEAKKDSNSLTETSDGSPIALEDLGIKITPPKGWEVSTNTGTLSVVMREPRNPNPAYDHAKYQRNITVAAIHKASPIDEKRAAELKEEMTKKFSQDSMVKDFQVLEHKFFNYRGTNDGLLLFSSLMIGEYQMMQMHVLVSGQSKQFLMSYTDLADQFQDQSNGTYDQAWQAMTSIEVTGDTPQRADEYMRYGAVGGGFVLVCLLGFFVRRKATRFDFSREADALEDAEGDLFMTSADSDKSGFAATEIAHVSEAARRVKAAYKQADIMVKTPAKAKAKGGLFAKKKKSDDDFALSGTEEALVVTGASDWKLDSASESDDDFAFSEAPRTKQTEYASNY